MSRVVQNQQLYLNLQIRKAIQANASALEMTLFSGVGELIGDLEPTIRQSDTPSHQRLAALKARFVPFTAHTGIRCLFTENKRLINAPIVLLAQEEYEISYNIRSIFPKLDISCRY
jgi:hypothetical protein